VRKSQSARGNFKILDMTKVTKEGTFMICEFLMKFCSTDGVIM
jgi:hypothetical protein